MLTLLKFLSWLWSIVEYVFGPAPTTERHKLTWDDLRRLAVRGVFYLAVYAPTFAVLTWLGAGWLVLTGFALGLTMAGMVLTVYLSAPSRIDPFGWLGMSTMVGVNDPPESGTPETGLA